MRLKRSDQILLVCALLGIVGILLATRAALSPEPRIAQFITKLTEPLDLNIATLEELIDLPGIGPVLAKRIIEYREAHGGFKNIEELLQIRGIGPKRLEQLKGRVRIGAPGK
uniref:Competence protein ComEA n=2 Tax=Candidatus Bipolaricaulota TaxID=67810 RepID=H5SC70_9BACT|nr:competence protein ComEA [uncultured Acetothermia bacterium]BAL59454.1 competence protein ComEA [Candidatus Acetothermum autotrophicum]